MSWWPGLHVMSSGVQPQRPVVIVKKRETPIETQGRLDSAARPPTTAALSVGSRLLIVILLSFKELITKIIKW